MKISTIIIAIVTAFAITLVSALVLIVSFSNEREAVGANAILKQAGLDLQNASDLLTNEARAYVQFGDKKYYDTYMNEVNVAKNREKSVATLEQYNSSNNGIDLAQALTLVRKASELSNTLAQLETRAFEAVEAKDLEAARELMFGSEYESGKAPIISTMQDFQKALNDATDERVNYCRSLANIMTILTIGLLIVTLAVIVFCLLAINRKIKMIGVLAGKATEIAGGNVAVEVDVSSNDEVGVLAKAFNDMLGGIKSQASMLDKLSSGDFSENITLRSDKDTMNLALNRMIDSYNHTMGEIRGATEQVSNGAKQIADSSQNLALGSTEQASAIEQLSGAISVIAQKTQKNAEMSTKAATLSNAIRDNAQKGSAQMGNMMRAVSEISEASQGINRVIKVIDDIAFQTNILALNAAVEAARAGQHGKGFAVVAEEVRSLAAKSAAAAKDTAGLIANSMEKAELGAAIATETSASLTGIVEGINESTGIIADIAKSTEEQSVGIAQINTGIDQVAQVVQQNSAVAEESAAASEEMSGQSTMLNDLVAQFRLKSDGGFARSSRASGQHALPAHYDSPDDFSGMQGYGKY